MSNKVIKRKIQS